MQLAASAYPLTVTSRHPGPGEAIAVPRRSCPSGMRQIIHLYSNSKLKNCTCFESVITGLSRLRPFSWGLFKILDKLKRRELRCSYSCDDQSRMRHQLGNPWNLVLLCHQGDIVRHRICEYKSALVNLCLAYTQNTMQRFPLKRCSKCSICVTLQTPVSSERDSIPGFSTDHTPGSVQMPNPRNFGSSGKTKARAKYRRMRQFAAVLVTSETLSVAPTCRRATFPNSGGSHRAMGYMPKVHIVVSKT
ncbi:hypothetical protein HD806DRAFT_70366 [Xylariaceae sp. AK1471]|nr:hypothetical protein HD806DRAFT_70366 [Xylariaceae sp. AK1471]